MEDKICHIFHRGLTISIEQYLPHPEGATVDLFCIAYILFCVGVRWICLNTVCQNFGKKRFLVFVILSFKK